VYTLQDEAMQLRRADALARNESGVILKFDWPQLVSTSDTAPGTSEVSRDSSRAKSSYVPWQSQINGVKVSVDVSRDGVDAEAVRKKPSAFLMCYGVLLYAPPQSGSSSIDCTPSSGVAAGSVSEWVALPGAYAPHCSPLLRGGGSLKPVTVPPLNSPTQPRNINGDAVLAAWLEPRRNTPSTSSLHDSIPPSTWLSDPSVLRTCGERRVGLVMLPIGPPLEEDELHTFDRIEEELTRPLLRLSTPTNGDEWAAEMAVAIDVDASIPEAEEIRADPTAYEVCVSGRPGDHLSVQRVADYCVSLVGGPPELPKVRPILSRQNHEMATSLKVNLNTDSLFEAGVEAWLQRRSSNGVESNPIAVARVDLSTLSVPPV